MAALTDTKHEAFAQFVAAGLSKTAAAVRAGFPENSSANTGCRLAKRPEIQQRIDELVDVIKNTEVPKLQWFIAQGIEIERVAIAASDYNAANKTLELLARLCGHLTDRKESYAERINIHEIRGAELSAALARELKQLPEAERAQIFEAEPELAELARNCQAEDQAPATSVDNKSEPE